MTTHSSHIARALADERVRELRRQAAARPAATGATAETGAGSRMPGAPRTRFAVRLPQAAIGRLRRAGVSGRGC